MTAPVGTEEHAANLALSHLKQREIATMSDDTKRAREVRRWFGQTRDATLREKWWNFATCWIVPAQEPLPGTGILTMRFPMPPDCVRVRFVENFTDDQWAIESGKATVGGAQVEASILVTSIAAPNVCYTRRIEAPRLWDALFVDVFALFLASNMAPRLNGSRTLSESLEARGREKLDAAGRIDSKEKAREGTRPEPSFLAARRGFRNYPYR